MKKIIDAVKTNLPESAIRIKKILHQLLNEVEFVMENLNDDGYLLDELYNIHEELDTAIELISLKYGQMNFINGINDIKIENKNRPNYKEFLVDNTIPHTLIENFTHIRPYGFKFYDDNLIETKTWIELYIKACELFLIIDEKKFLSFENKTIMNGEVKDYFSKEKQNMDLPIKLLNKFHISTKFDANGFRDMLMKIIKEYNFSIEQFRVYWKADYNPLHNK